MIVYACVPMNYQPRVCDMVEIVIFGSAKTLSPTQACEWERSVNDGQREKISTECQTHRRATKWKDLANIIWLARTNSYLHTHTHTNSHILMFVLAEKFRLGLRTQHPFHSSSIRWHIIKIHNTKIISFLCCSIFFFVLYLCDARLVCAWVRVCVRL